MRKQYALVGRRGACGMQEQIFNFSILGHVPVAVRVASTVFSALTEKRTANRKEKSIREKIAKTYIKNMKRNSNHDDIYDGDDLVMIW